MELLQHLSPPNEKHKQDLLGENNEELSLITQSLMRNQTIIKNNDSKKEPVAYLSKKYDAVPPLASVDPLDLKDKHLDNLTFFQLCKQVCRTSEEVLRLTNGK